MKKDSNIIIRTTSDLKESIIQITKKNQISVSELINTMLLDIAHKGSIPAVTLSKIKAKRMNKEVNFLSIKKAVEDAIAAWGKENIEKAYLFGSYSRNEQKENSDVDIRIVTKSPFTMSDFSCIKNKLENLLDKKVDLITTSEDRMDPILLKEIKKDQICIYEL